MSLPLASTTVLEFAGNLPGPYAGRLLADLGATVIKVEDVKHGDPTRAFPGLFARLNHGKRSLALDLKSDAAAQALPSLIAGSDVVIESFRPGVAARLGIAFSDCIKSQPRIVHAAISGFGQATSLSPLPAHDLNLQAFTGMTKIFGGSYEKGEIAELPLCDFVTALFASLQVTAALSLARLSGKPQAIDVGMADGLAHLIATWYSDSGADSTQKLPLLSALPHYRLFSCADGKRIAIGIVAEPHFWESLCDVLGGACSALKAWPFSQRMQRKAEVERILEERILTRSSGEWFGVLQTAELPVTLEQEPRDLPGLAYFRERGLSTRFGEEWMLRSPLCLPQTPFNKSPFDKEDPAKGAHEAPTHGQHSETILEELGFEHEKVRSWITAGMVSRS